jgi:hypothetical protein
MVVATNEIGTRRIWGVQTTYSNLEETKKGNKGESQCQDVVINHRK